MTTEQESKCWQGFSFAIKKMACDFSLKRQEREFAQGLLSLLAKTEVECIQAESAPVASPNC